MDYSRNSKKISPFKLNNKTGPATIYPYVSVEVVYFFFCKICAQNQKWSGCILCEIFAQLPATIWEPFSSITIKYHCFCEICAKNRLHIL